MNAVTSGADKIRKAMELKGISGAREPAAAAAQRPAPVASVPGTAKAPPVSTRTVAVDAARLHEHRILARDDRGFAAQSFKALRTQVVQMMSRSGYRSLAVVSPATGDGRTTTAINLAASIADDPDHTCLLVDLDLRRPCVADWFGITVERDVAACLRGLVPVGEVMVRPQGYGRLSLLPAVRGVAGSEELLAADSTRRVIEEVHQRYANRFVVYDLPPLLEAADALAFLPSVDAVLIVVQEGRTRREDVLRCLDLLRDTPVVGTVLAAARDVRGF